MAAACIQCIIALVVCLCAYIRQVANIGSDLFECVQHQIFYLTNASESIPFANSALAIITNMLEKDEYLDLEYWQLNNQSNVDTEG